MADEFFFEETIDPESLEWEEGRGGVSRREFVQILGAGLLLTATSSVALGQRRARRRIRRRGRP